MSERKEPIRKTPAEVLADLMSGHDAALSGGHDRARKYLLSFAGRALSLCDRAIALGMGKAYEAKRASIERMPAGGAWNLPKDTRETEQTRGFLLQNRTRNLTKPENGQKGHFRQSFAGKPANRCRSATKDCRNSGGCDRVLFGCPIWS